VARAQTLRFVTGMVSGPFDAKAPGFEIEVTKRVFAAMDRNVSFEYVPFKRAYMMIARGQRDGMPAMFRATDPEGVCSFPDEPLLNEKWVLFIRTADIGKLKFSSFDDIARHDTAIHEVFLSGDPNLSPELGKFLREHHNLVGTSDDLESLRMLAAGRVDYAAVEYAYGMFAMREMGLSGTIKPLLSRNLGDQGVYVCFTKAPVSPAFVAAFSRALKQFKQTETYKIIYLKYFP
jgi:polar amino acid transport system substrate-binding protein